MIKDIPLKGRYTPYFERTNDRYALGQHYRDAAGQIVEIKGLFYEEWAENEGRRKGRGRNNQKRQVFIYSNDPNFRAKTQLALFLDTSPLRQMKLDF